ncbi:hypothetical protein AVEN_63873-1 [Araneus ventricosus]|uniref:Uncharacterized protein n=1 Tax=Araneus ventricosus TaxID=182803 RepID=A0A4Y2M467_ARAVE|nr:hypothetical protein AVEN_63873-1 [Araneus ventricosus]
MTRPTPELAPLSKLPYHTSEKPCRNSKKCLEFEIDFIFDYTDPFTNPGKDKESKILLSVGKMHFEEFCDF